MGQSGGGVGPAPAGAYLVYGKEDFLKREFLRDLSRRLFPTAAEKDLNFREFHSGEEPLSSVIEFLQTTPFLSPRRLAVLWAVESLPAGEKETLLTFLSRAPSFAVAVMVSSEGSVKKDAFLGALAGRCRQAACHPPMERDLPGWIEQEARKAGFRVERQAAYLLIERAGRGLAFLAAALEQLVVYVHPRKIVGVKDVEELVGKSIQTFVFDLADALLEKNTAAALKMTESLLKEGVRAVEIVGVLAGQLERLGKAVERISGGGNPRQVALELKIHPYFAEKFCQQAKRYSVSQIRRLKERLLFCDESIKTGRLAETLAVEKFILDLLPG